MSNDLINQRNLMLWMGEIEEWLVEKIDGMTTEGSDILVSHTYIQKTARIVDIVEEEYGAMTPYYLLIQFSALEREAFPDLVFAPSRRIEARLEVPVEHNSRLVIEEADPLDALLNPEAR